jgi:hypothetical protein
MSKVQGTITNLSKLGRDGKARTIARMAGCFPIGLYHVSATSMLTKGLGCVVGMHCEEGGKATIAFINRNEC